LGTLWRQGQAPNVADFLATAGTRDPDELLAVLRVDQFERFRLGESVRVETYIDAVPALAGYREQTLDLIFAEYLLREESGERPAAEEYFQRFPQYAQELKLQLELNQALGTQFPLPSSRTAEISTQLDRWPFESGGESAGLLEIPGYTVLGVLGRGGMGVVYRAWQQDLNRPVAIKMVYAGAQDSPAILDRFRVEAEAVARLKHQNIVQIHDVGRHAGSPYLVLELVEGHNLAQRLAGTPQPVAWAAGLVETLARAIQAAHDQGVVHRDLTPANVLLTTDGIPKITDFGLAKLIKGGQELRTQTGDLLGTPSYMAPEQAASRNQAIGVVTDVYALGAILYELLTGRPPFKAESPIETLRQVVSDEPVAPSRLRPRLPRDLETICLKCLRKEPPLRYASTLELADDLRRFQEGRPILARRSGSFERAWRWCRRNPALATASSAAVLLTTALAIGSTIAAWTYRDQRNDLKYEHERTKVSLTRAERAERQVRLELGKTLMAEGAALERSGLPGQRYDSLDRLAHAARELRDEPEGHALLPEVRDHAIGAMALTDLRMRWQRAIGAVMWAACDGELGRYAVTELRSGLTKIRSLDDDRELLRVPRPETGFWFAAPEFSSGGRYLLIKYNVGLDDKWLDIWNLERPDRVIHQPVRSIAHAFHPDGRGLLFAPPGPDLVLWDLIARRVVKRLPLDFHPSYLVFDPTGRRIAVNAASPPFQLQVRHLDAERAPDSWTDQVGDGPMSWSHDGRLLAIGHSDGRVFVWDLVRRRLASILHGHASAVIVCQFAPASELLATGAWDGTVRLWDAAVGEELLVTSDSFLGFASDGRRAAFVDGPTLRIRDVARDRAVRIINPAGIGNQTETTYGDWVLAGRFSPDGRLVALASGWGLHLYDTSDLRELAHLEAGDCESVLFDVDGRNLITSSRWGLFRWPIRPEPDGGAEVLLVGPPELLQDQTPGQRESFKASWLHDHRTLAMIDNLGARVLLVDTTHPRRAGLRDRALASGSNHRMSSIAISPDGRWAAAGGWMEKGIYVWDLPRSRLVRVLPPSDGEGDSQTIVTFSPDGRWLISSSQNAVAPGYYFWEVGTWKRGPLISRPLAAGWGAPVFSADGRVMALGVSSYQIRLAEAATMRTIAHLSTLQPMGARPLAFSPDGTKLIAATNRKTALMWDLRRIREQLATMDLDWDQPSFPPESETLTTIRPSVRSIRVVGKVIEPSARRAAELAALKERLRTHSDDADALFERGGMELRARRWTEAIADLEHSLRVRPDHPDVPLLLAEAYLQTQRLLAARNALDRHLARFSDDLDAHLGRGLVALSLGQTEAAADHFTRVLAADPDDEVARYRRARAWLALGRSQDALADFGELIRSHPQSTAFLELRGEVHERLGHHQAAQADRERAAGLLQPSARELNNTAWELATGAGYLRDPERAVSLARKAVATEPDQAIYLNTLGVALYRAGRYVQAIATLQQTIAAKTGQFDAFDLFFLAMARHRLGQTVQARDSFDRAVRWWREQKQLPDNAATELAGFRAEAEAVLAGPGDELPDDVFAGRVVADTEPPEVPGPDRRSVHQPGTSTQRAD
jgi:WD40 repeat protein/Tfp pilus assembly protein PilF